MPAAIKTKSDGDEGGAASPGRQSSPKADETNWAVVNQTNLWPALSGIPALLSVPGTPSWLLAFCEPGAGWPAAMEGRIVLRRTHDLRHWGDTAAVTRGSNPAPTYNPHTKEILLVYARHG